MRTQFCRTGFTFAVVGIAVFVWAHGYGLIATAAPKEKGDPSSSVALPKSPSDKIAIPVTTPAVVAIRFHHDMCPYCRQMQPEFTELSRKSYEEPVLFLTLDVSSRASQRDSALLVGALGLEPFWPGDYSKLGTVTFIDFKTKKLIGSVRALDDKTIGKALSDALASLGSKR